MPSIRPNEFDTATKEGWLNELAFQLRLRDVPGDQVGEILATVDSHCADSGEEPLVAFGEPTAYADSLPLTRTTSASWPVIVAPVLLTTGINLLLAALLNWGVGAPITVGTLLAAAILVVFAVVMLVFAKQILGKNPGVGILVWFGLGFVLMLAASFLRTPIAIIPTWSALLLGALGVAAGVWLLRSMPDDPIIDPRKA